MSDMIRKSAMHELNYLTSVLLVRSR